MCTRSRSWFVSPRCSILLKKPNKMLGEVGGRGRGKAGKVGDEGRRRGSGSRRGYIVAPCDRSA